MLCGTPSSRGKPPHQAALLSLQNIGKEIIIKSQRSQSRAGSKGVVVSCPYCLAGEKRNKPTD